MYQSKQGLLFCMQLRQQHLWVEQQIFHVSKQVVRQVEQWLKNDRSVQTNMLLLLFWFHTHMLPSKSTGCCLNDAQSSGLG